MGTTVRREFENCYFTTLTNYLKVYELKKIHAHVVTLSLSQSNYGVTKMLDSCDNMGQVSYATLLFQHLVHPKVFSYNAIIRTYTHNRHYSQAITLFIQMLTNSMKAALPDKFTFPFVIKSCAGLLCHSFGMQVHALVYKFGPYSHSVTENALNDMYTQCGDLTNVCHVFDEMTRRDTVSWNSLIFGYERLGQMKSARELFDEMPCRTIVCWTSMISGYARMGCYGDALEIFREMQMVGVPKWA